MKNSVSFQPVLKITHKSTADIPAYRFVGFGGALCSSDAKSLGVTDKSWASGKNISIIVLGTAAIESVGNITVGDPLTSDGQGRAIVAGDGAINARALESTSNGGVIKVLLVP